MKLRASEFISKAEDLKSSEMSVRQRLEGIRSRRASVQSEISTLEYQLDALYMQLEALESADSGDDEDGTDNSGAIAAVMAEISSTQDDISENRQEDAELRTQEMEASAELRQIEMEEQETLSDIQDSAARTNQNIALISSFGGDYANVSAQAAGSFQHNLGQLSQAAQILGGSVAMGGGGAGGRAPGRMSKGNAGSDQGSGRNFYEAANNQRKSGGSSSAMGAKGSGGTAGVRKAPDLYTDSSSGDESPKIKTGGLGNRLSGLKQNIANAFNLGGAVKEFSGCTAVKRSDQQDGWDIPGIGFAAYDDFRNNHDNYERTTYDKPRMETAKADNIEGISNIRTADIEHPEIFWGRDSGKTMQDFMDIAQHIPEVEKQLQAGRSLDDLMMDDRLGKCAAIYFADAPIVYKGEGFYEFSGNGRHRILAARALGLSIPVRVAGEIKAKKNGGMGQKTNAFKESLKFNPSSTMVGQDIHPPKPNHGPRDPREREIEYERALGSSPSASKKSPFGMKPGITNSLPKNQILAGKISIFSKHAGKLGADFVDDMHNVLKESAHDDVKSVYEKYADKLTVHDALEINGRAKYQHGKGIIINTNVVKRGSRIHKPYQVVFHEFAHNLDYVLGGGDPISEKWGNGALYKAIQKDFDALKGEKSNKELIESIRKQMKDNNWSYMSMASVSDILECMTGMDYPLGSGHGQVEIEVKNPDGSFSVVTQSYWKNRLPCKEFFAEVLDGAAANEESYKMLCKMFPNAVDVVHKIVGGAI